MATVNVRSSLSSQPSDGTQLKERLGPVVRALSAAYSPAGERITDALTRDVELRGMLFRLVDVAPACEPAELGDHLNAFATALAGAPSSVRLASRLSDGPLREAMIGRVVGAAVRHMARRFIVGESPAGAARELERLWRRGIASTIDLLGEATATPEEADAYARRCEAALVELAERAACWPARPLLESDPAGSLPRVNMSVKVTALTPVMRAAAPERAIHDARHRLERILSCARALDAHVHIDMESFDSHEAVLGLVLDVLSTSQFESGPSAGIVLQAYLRDSEATLERILDWAHRTHRAVPLTIRLVKGAYWDHEVIQASQAGWEPPVWTEKFETDRCFDRLSRRLLEEFPAVRTAIASHNPDSLRLAVSYARAHRIARSAIELQVLRGLGEPLAAGFARNGVRCRTYCPVGDLVGGMAYLVRRLLENTSNQALLAMPGRPQRPTRP